MAINRTQRENRGVIRIRIPLGGPTSIEAIDLAGDHWEDYESNLADAADAERSGALRRRNRFLRAALWNLVGHLDGVLCDLDAALTQRGGYPLIRKRDRTNQRGRSRRCLRDKAQDIRDFAKRKSADPGPLRLRLKVMRDVATHPGIVQQNPAERSKVFAPADLYRLTVADIEREGGAISAWLDRICKTFGYRRFVDTKTAVEQYSRVLGGSDQDVTRI